MRDGQILIDGRLDHVVSGTVPIGATFLVLDVRFYLTWWNAGQLVRVCLRERDKRQTDRERKDRVGDSFMGLNLFSRSFKQKRLCLHFFVP